MEESEKYNPRIADFIRSKACKLARRSEFRHEDVADIEQELVLELMTRWPHFKPELTSPMTFVYRVVVHKISDMIAQRTALKRDVRRGGLALKDDDLARMPPEQRDLRIDLEKLLARLPPEEFALCAQLCVDTITEIALERGMPRSTLYGEIGRLRQRFRKAGLQTYL